MPMRSPSAAASATSASARTAVAASPREQQVRVLVGGVREPGRGSHAPVQLHGALEVLLRALPTRRACRPACRGSGRRPRSRRRGGRPSRSRRRAARAPGRRAPPRPRRRALCRHRSGRSSDASQSDSRKGSSPPATSRDSSRLASASIPSSASSATSPGRHGPSRAAEPARILVTGASSARRPCSRRTLNIWIPYTPEASLPDSRRPDSCERRASASASLEPTVAQRDGRAVVLGHVDHERLGRALRGLAQDGDLVPGGLEVAEGHERRHAPGHRLDADLVVAQLAAELGGLGQHVEDLLQRDRATRPVGAHQHRCEAYAVVEPPRHRRSRCPDDRSAFVVALEVERAGEPAEQSDAELRVAVAERRRGLLEKLDRALARPFRVASMRPRSRSRPGRAAARCPAPARSPLPTLNASRASSAFPPRWRALPELERTQPLARAGPRSPSSSAIPSRSAASSKASAAVAARAAPHVVLHGAPGVPEGSGGGEVVREIGERAAGACAGALERFADAEMELRPPHARQPVVQRPSHELVCESACQRGAGVSSIMPLRMASSSAATQLGFPEPGCAADDVELELGSRRGGELEEIGGSRREARRAAGSRPHGRSRGSRAPRVRG